jgi:hypothetical protein
MNISPNLKAHDKKSVNIVYLHSNFLQEQTNSKIIEQFIKYDRIKMVT